MGFAKQLFLDWKKIDFWGDFLVQEKLSRVTAIKFWKRKIRNEKLRFWEFIYPCNAKKTPKFENTYLVGSELLNLMCGF